MNSTLLTALAVATCIAPVTAQSFNLDFGEPLTGPSSLNLKEHCHP